MKAGLRAGFFVDARRLNRRLIGQEFPAFLEVDRRILPAVGRKPLRSTTHFLNVSGRHLLSLGHGVHGETFERLLGICGLKPEQIILKILEARVDDIEHLNKAVEAYRHGMGEKIPPISRSTAGFALMHRPARFFVATTADLRPS